MKIFNKFELKINGIKPELVIPLDTYKNVSEEMQELEGKICKIEIKEVKDKRSLNQNAMYWELINKIAERIGVSDTDVHMQMLRDYGVIEGVYKVIKGEIQKKYFDQIDRDTYKVYKGSSEMNTKEFKRLLEGVIYEAKEIGLEV